MQGLELARDTLENPSSLPQSSQSFLIFLRREGSSLCWKPLDSCVLYQVCHARRLMF